MAARFLCERPKVVAKPLTAALVASVLDSTSCGYPERLRRHEVIEINPDLRIVWHDLGDGAWCKTTGMVNLGNAVARKVVQHAKCQDGNGYVLFYVPFGVEGGRTDMPCEAVYLEQTDDGYQLWHARIFWTGHSSIRLEIKVAV